MINGYSQLVSDFFSIDYFGKTVALSPFPPKRGVSLSGLLSQLIAVGGSNDTRELKICEKYSVITNKWIGLPPLNTSRLKPGSIVLESMRSFCFCGWTRHGGALSSIETIDPEKESQWTTLPLSIAKANDIAAAHYKTKIILFGEENIVSFLTYVLNEEGALEQDCSHYPQIPSAVSSGSFKV